MTRKEFLKTAAGVAAASALPAAAPAAAARRGPKRGVSVYSYPDVNITYTLEDCLAEIDDCGAEGYEMGVEILTGVIEDYPNPSDAWVKNWHDMCAKYHIRPVELGHWIDSKLYAEGPEGLLSTKESYDQLVQDIKLANRLGFTHGRTKIGVIDEELSPVKNYREFIKMALPVAAKYNFRMQTEVHNPTTLNMKLIDEYVDFIEKEKATPWFGFNIDFGILQDKGRLGADGKRGAAPPHSKPEEIVRLLPYIHCCHAKFNEMNDDPDSTTIPYAEIIKILVDHNWNNYLLAEYEGADKRTGGAFTAVRKHQIMLKRLLGEV